MAHEHFVIVGGSKGIGLGIVKRLARDGNSVTVLSRTGDNLQGLNGVQHIAFDVTLDAPIANLPAEIHGLVYCPGSLNLRSFRSLSPDIFRQDFEINVIGAVKVIQAAMGGLKEAGRSSVVLFSTVAVGQGMFAHASIAASKGAIEGLTRTLAAELSPEVRVNCLAPALTNTALTQKFFADPAKAAGMGEKYPLGRTGTVDDLAAMACFLLGPESSWITGQVIGIDGGMASIRK
jgi:3-oxoacyl-[acyl-carrier protein] reductase